MPGRWETQRGKVLTELRAAFALAYSSCRSLGVRKEHLEHQREIDTPKAKPGAGPLWPGTVGGRGGSLAPGRRGGQVSSPHSAEGGDWKSGVGGLFL